MNSRKALNQIRKRRTARNRARILGTAARPRLAVFRSNRGMLVQLIDDSKGQTLASFSAKKLDKSEVKKKTEQAQLIGEKIAEAAKAKGIKSAVFDRRSYAYHGRVKALAEGVRKGGLQI